MGLVLLLIGFLSKPVREWVIKKMGRFFKYTSVRICHLFNHPYQAYLVQNDLYYKIDRPLIYDANISNEVAQVAVNNRHPFTANLLDSQFQTDTSLSIVPISPGVSAFSLIPTMKNNPSVFRGFRLLPTNTEQKNRATFTVVSTGEFRSTNFVVRKPID